ncbi:nucleotidyltransferase family protein [uncultured Maribacter sp.]|uniref:nucleotidyltransferase family protein n=1 Tax=uncultured Maribacter sp. TaxID=431308 RepID=UPI00260232C5|nr:nucleotidyltransferase family protein [uncultured Maribacter sp.]
MRNNIAILILAAGSSSRMNAVKQLLPWKGSTFLGHTIQVAKASSANEIFVVLGAHTDLIKLECKKYAVEYVLNKNWEEGMGTSIACGITHLSRKKENYDGVLVLVCDQPFINTEYINTVLQASNENVNNIYATKYTHGVGVPALFKSSHFKELRILSKDFGARQILRREKNNIKKITPNFNTTDIDTKKSYDSLYF